MLAPLESHMGVLAAITWGAGWTLLFAPQYVGRDSGGRSPRTLLRASAILTAMMTTVAMLAAWYGVIGTFLGTLWGVVILCVVAAVGIAVLTPPPRKAALAVWTGLYALLTVPLVLSTSKIAYRMWNKEHRPGVPVYGDASTLFWIHVLLLLFCFALIVILCGRRPKRNPQAVLISALASVLYVICISVVFFYTIPREGDESLFIWIFLYPVFYFMVFIQLATSVVALICSADRLSQASRRAAATGNTWR